MDKRDYKCILTGGSDEITEKRSRFIASVAPVTTEEEALAFIEEVRKANRTARHNCYAYTFGMDPATTRFSDDGEPAGTAGRPMLDVLTGQELHNTAVVVTRYFGGILLGTGGLVRAYTDAVKAGINASTVITKSFGKKLLIGTDYSGLGKIQYLAGERNIPVLDTEYAEDVTVTVFVTPDTEDEFCKALLDQTFGRARITQLETCFCAKTDGRLLTFTS